MIRIGNSTQNLNNEYTFDDGNVILQQNAAEELVTRTIRGLQLLAESIIKKQ